MEFDLDPYSDPWWEQLKNDLCEIFFPYEEYQQQVLDNFDQLGTEVKRIDFITKWKSLVHGIHSRITYPTEVWRQSILTEIYIRVYHHPSSSRYEKCMAISYLISIDHYSPEMVVSLLEWVREEEDGESIDILHRYPYVMNTDQREWFFERMRLLRGVPLFDETYHLLIPPAVAEMLPRTIYEDPQNVHDSSIQESLWRNIQILQKEEIMSEERWTFLQNEITSSIDKATHASWRRLLTDPTTFQREENSTTITTTLLQTLKMVLSYIDRQENEIRSVLLERLKEELIEMQGSCGSGHLSRTVNCLMGFHPEIRMEINSNDRLKATFQTILQKFLETREDLWIEMSNAQPEWNGPLVKFIQKHEQKIQKEIKTVLKEEDLNVQDELPRLWEETFPLHKPNPFRSNPDASPSLFQRYIYPWLVFFYDWIPFFSRETIKNE